MNKKELTQFIVDRSKVTGGARVVTLEQARECLNGLAAAVGATLRKGGAVQYAGLGTFDVKKMAARVGRNPKTGLPMVIAAQKKPRFKPGAKLSRTLV